MRELLASGAGALLFAGSFWLGGRMHPLKFLLGDRRSGLSFGAGMSAAYVFVHLMPELHAVRGEFTESLSIPLKFEGMVIYYTALVGFLLFHGLERLRARSPGGTEAQGDTPAFRLHVGGFAVYVGLMAYLLVRRLDETALSVVLYAVAITFHLLSVDHSLRNEHGVTYDRVGRPLLAGMSLLGWGVGRLVAAPPYVVALLVAFVSGAIIINSAIMELPSEKEGRFVPFLMGSLLYGLVLLPLG